VAPTFCTTCELLLMIVKIRSCTTPYSTVSGLLYVVLSGSYVAKTVQLHEISIHLQKASDKISPFASSLSSWR